MGTWLTKARQFQRERDWRQTLRVRHINLFLAMVFSLAGAVVIAVFAAWILAPGLNVGNETTPPADLTRLALTVAAGVGGVVALVVAYRRQRDLEQGRFLEGFGAAAKQLGDPDVAVRLAGAYAMAGVADQTSSLKRQQCIDVLCGYLRLPYSPELGNNHQQSMVLKKPVRRKGGIEEELRFQYRQNDREVRQTIVRVIAAHVQKKAACSWSSNDFDFTGSQLEDPNFDKSIFNGRSTSFAGTTFSGEGTSFDRATFSGGVTSFDRAIFGSKRTSFERATFSGGMTSFGGATFGGNRTSFGEAVFRGVWTNFGAANFTGRWISFDQSTFSGMVAWFAHATFSGGETSFLGVDFGVGEVTFDRPGAWDPAPAFDWDIASATTSKPANVKPNDWPPAVEVVSKAW